MNVCLLVYGNFYGHEEMLMPSSYALGIYDAIWSGANRKFNNAQLGVTISRQAATPELHAGGKETKINNTKKEKEREE